MSAMEQILAIVESIPAGRVTTYGSIADVVEGATARSVGHALKTGGHAVPWWRVVTASGRPAPGAEHAAHERFLEEKTPLDTAGDGTYAVDVAAAIWHIPDDVGYVEPRQDHEHPRPPATREAPRPGPSGDAPTSADACRPPGTPRSRGYTATGSRR